MTRSKSKVLEDHDDTRQHPIETAVILREKAVHAAFARRYESYSFACVSILLT